MNIWSKFLSWLHSQKLNIRIKHLIFLYWCPISLYAYLTAIKLFILILLFIFLEVLFFIFFWKNILELCFSKRFNKYIAISPISPINFIWRNNTWIIWLFLRYNFNNYDNLSEIFVNYKLLSELNLQFIYTSIFIYISFYISFNSLILFLI